MSKLSPQDNHANQLNANKGTSGFNKQYLAVQKKSFRAKESDQ